MTCFYVLNHEIFNNRIILSVTNPKKTLGKYELHYSPYTFHGTLVLYLNLSDEFQFFATIGNMFILLGLIQRLTRVKGIQY